MHVETFDSLSDAVEAAVWANDAGDENVESIEVRTGSESMVYKQGALDRLMSDLQARHAAERALRPVATVHLRIQSPSGNWAIYSGYVDGDEAEVDAARFRSALGPDRVNVEQVGHRPTP